MLTLAATLFVLGVLIFVHELGHFMAAKAAGIAVPRFSIGFGPPTPLSFRRGETEYLVSWIPFGGYVKMASLEEQQAMESLEGGGLEQEFPPEKLFESKPLFARIVVLAAGVIMNALFAWAVYSGLVIAYGKRIDPTTAVAAIDAETLPAGAEALAEVPFGAEVAKINGEPVESWNDIMDGVLDPRSDRLSIEFLTGEPPVKSVVVAEVPGADAERRAQIAQAILPLWEPRVGYLVQGKPAERAGLKPGDLITHVGGQPLPSWHALVEAVEASLDQPMRLAIDRAGETVELEVTPAAEDVTDPITGEVRKAGRIGIGPERQLEHVELGVAASIAEGARQTWDNATQVLAFVKGLVLGQVSIRQLGGPILIGQASGQVARAGFVPLLSFMAFLSVNLAILNLLPIPVLDGGHLIFLMLEGLRGKPLPQSLRLRLTQAGMFVLLGIMAFAVINDIFRIVG